MSLIQSDVVRVFEKWALGIYHGPEGSVLVTGMNGEVVQLDAGLVEQRRWQAHEGSVNALAVAGAGGLIWTGGGDGLVKAWDWTSLAPLAVFSGPRKPITRLFFDQTSVIAQSYERAVFVWDRAATDALARKIAKVATLVQTESGWYGCPQIGSKAGDIGALAPLDLTKGVFGEAVFDDAYAAWSLGQEQRRATGRGILAFGLDLRACFIDVQKAHRTNIEWHSKSGPPGYLPLADGSELFFGDGRLYHRAQAQKGPVKGLYGALQLPDTRVAIAGADGQIWVYEIRN